MAVGKAGTDGRQYSRCLRCGKVFRYYQASRRRAAFCTRKCLNAHWHEWMAKCRDEADKLNNVANAL